MEKIYRELGDKIAFVGINHEDNEKIEEFVKKYGLSFPVALDRKRSIAAVFNARIPTYVLIDKHGTIKYLAPVFPERNDLEKILR